MEKVSLKLGGGLTQCYIHTPIMSWEIIIQNFYARISRKDQTMLDTSCVGSFMKKTTEFRWDLLERIKRNSKDWELDKGKETGIKLKYDCVKSNRNTDNFEKN